MTELWKLHRDPYYSELFQQHGLDYAIEAGFFFDTDQVDRQIQDTVGILCTPISFPDLDKMDNPCVLLSTGAYCPAHYGHVEMMDLAKQEVEKQGFQVAGAYLSPGHDEYIQLKTGEEWIPIHQRIALLYKAIGNRPWLKVDPWEGIFNQVAVNFTDVIVRLEAYLKHHLGRNIPVIYVFGGDNARFAKTFDNHGYGVIIERPGYADSMNISNPRIFTATGTSDISSSQVRAQTSLGSSKIDSLKALRLRVGSDSNEQQVIEHLNPRFSSIKQQQVDEQQQVFDQLALGESVVSLDTELQGGSPLGISRHYDLFGGRRLRYGNRPGVDLSAQLAELQLKKCILFDDDIHSGGTMRYARSLLETRDIEVSGIISLNISKEGEEIADARDFLFGSGENDGLVVQLPDNSLSRVPYLYPYVCPYLRASITDPLQFSIVMWQLNADIYQDTNTQIGDVPYLTNLAKCLGYPPQKPLAEICLEHVAMLKSAENA